MTTTLIALLRGINVGKAKRIAMADLRDLVTDLGYTDVRTLLNSGNVVFNATASSAKNAGAKIEKALVAETGVSAKVMIITAVELASAIAKNPFLKIATDPSRMMVGVLDDAASQSRLKEVLAQKWPQGAVAVKDRMVYYWCPDGILDSKLALAVGKTLKESVTTRNWATMQKLHALASGGAD